MRKFTKSLLTLALLVFAVGGAKAQAEVDIKDLQAANGTTDAWVASIPATYPTSPIDVKDSQTIFGSDASSQATNANVNKYDYIYFEVVNFSTARACRIFFWDPNSNSRKDWYIRPVEGKDEVTDWGAAANVTGNGTYCVKIPTGARLQGAKTPWVQTPEEGVLYQFSKIYVIEPADPLAGLKDLLQQAIDKGKTLNSFAKTTASWNTLLSAISDGEAELTNANATEESLNAATQAIAFAIAGLKLQDGYTNLTKAMANGNVDYTLNSSTGLPYGTSTVDMNTYAELNEFDQFIVLAAAGKPRFCMNRLTADGQIGDDLEQSKMIDINPNNGITWATEKYQTIDENKYTLDLKKIAADWNGLARLNCIKGANYANVTVTDMLLYRTITVDAAGYATFGSVSKNAKPNGVKAYAAKVNGTKVELTEVTNVPAGKGVVIEASAGSYAPTFDVDADDIESELLVSDGTVAGDGTIFVLANKNSVPGFYKLANDQKVPAGKAYLKVTTGAPEFLPFEGNTTGIEIVKSVESKGQFFNLAGQRVAQPAKGLYIVNGKKVIFK